MAMWKRHLFVGLGALAVVVLGTWLLRSWHPWGILTTVDPRILGLVGTTSMEVIELGMHNRRVDTRDGPRDRYGTPTIRTPIDKQIWFKLPAAYVTVVDLQKGPEGPQRLGFSFWYPSGDPYMPVLLNSDRVVRPDGKGATAPHSPAKPSPFEAYRDQIEVSFELGGHQLATDDQRQRALSADIRWQIEQGKPCVQEKIAEPKAILFSPSPEGNPYQSCISSGHNDAFLLLRVGDSDQVHYTVQCGRRGPVNCRLLGYFGTWGFIAWIPYADNRSWDDLHNAIQAFLKKYATRVD
jgi:hypothetical protein